MAKAAQEEGHGKPANAGLAVSLQSDMWRHWEEAALQISADGELEHVFNRLESLGCYKSPLTYMKELGHMMADCQN